MALFSKESANAVSEVSGVQGPPGEPLLSTDTRFPKDDDFLGNSYFEVFTKFQLNI